MDEKKTLNTNEDDDLKIRDAVTDKTIISAEEVQNIRAEAAKLEAEDDTEDILKIRDAVTDQTIVSVEDAKNVRLAAAHLDLDDGLDVIQNDMFASRNESADKTIIAGKEVQEIHDAVSELDISELMDDDETQPQPIVVEKKSVKKNKKKQKKIRESQIAEDASDEIDFDELIQIEEFEPQPVKKDLKRRSNRQERRRPAPYADRYDDYSDYNDYDFDDREQRYSRNYHQESRRRHTYYEEPVKNPLRFIPLVLVIAICVFGFITAREVCLDTPVNANNYSKVRYTVTSETTDASLAKDLKELGLIENPLVFRLRCIFYDADYKEGTYELCPCYSTEKIINILSGYEYGSDQ